MKKIMTTVCALACAAFLCACAAGQEGKTDLDDSERERTEEIADVPEEEGRTEKTVDAAEEERTEKSADAPEEGKGTEKTADAPEEGKGTEKTADVPEERTEENTDMPDETAALPTVQMRGLMQGKLGGIGLGVLAYTVPEQKGEDYRLCFFKEGGKVSGFGKPLSEADYYSLEMADYIFPDVRENNAPIGKFMEIYFFDTVTIGEDDAAGLAIVAAYDVNGSTCYDTRIYRWNGTDYSAEEKLMQEFNEQYGSTQDYPAQELYRLSCDDWKRHWQNRLFMALQMKKVI